MVPKITILGERRLSDASIISMSSTSSRGPRDPRIGPGDGREGNGGLPDDPGDQDSLDLPYPQYKRISLYYFEQDSLPRLICLKMMTSPYPFSATMTTRLRPRFRCSIIRSAVDNTYIHIYVYIYIYRYLFL